jgi:Uncharacterized conserved protein (DUF2190)
VSVTDYTAATDCPTHTFVAASAVASGDPLQVAGPGVVRRITTAGALFVGIAAHAAGPNQRLTVYVSGPIHQGQAFDAIAAGDAVIPAFVAGTQVMRYAPPTGTPGVSDLAMLLSVCGVALTTAAAGEKVRWLAYR